MSMPFCPILKGECYGIGCAMAVKLNHPNISPYTTYWACGLVNNKEIAQYGNWTAIYGIQKDYGSRRQKT